MKNLEKLEKDFILDNDAELEDLESLIERILRFSKIDIAGHVVVTKDLEKKLPIKEPIQFSSK